jgi:hypothetical protein
VLLDQKWDGGKEPLFPGIHFLPAALADTRCGEGVAVRPTLAVRSSTNRAELHFAGIAKSTNLTYTDLLLASTALLVWQLALFSYYGLERRHSYEEAASSMSITKLTIFARKFFLLNSCRNS